MQNADRFGLLTNKEEMVSHKFCRCLNCQISVRWESLSRIRYSSRLYPAYVAHNSQIFVFIFTSCQPFIIHTKMFSCKKCEHSNSSEDMLKVNYDLLHEKFSKKSNPFQHQKSVDEGINHPCRSIYFERKYCRKPKCST